MDNERRSKKPTFFSALGDSIRRGVEKKKSEKSGVVADLLVFAIAFFFSRRHIAFGSYPLAAALVAILPKRVVTALLGAVVGAFTMGKEAVIHAIISMLIFFLRVIISASDKESVDEGVDEGGGALFSEPLIMRLSAATIGAFVGAGYEMLLRGFSMSSVTFGVFGVLSTLGFSLLFSGILTYEISVSDFLFGTGTIFGAKENEGYKRAAFEISLLSFAFLIAYSLADYVYFGISFSYIFVIALTLFFAKRFGTVRAAAIGFAASIGIAPAYSPAFALIGVGAGFLFSFGISYALIGACVLFVLWGSYIDGLSGFLSLFPEYLIASCLIITLLKKTKREEVSGAVSETDGGEYAEQLVGAAWLSDRGKINSVAALGESLGAAADEIRNFLLAQSRGDFDAYRDIVESVFLSVSQDPCGEIVNKIATILYKNKRVDQDLANELSLTCAQRESLGEIYRRVGEYEKGLYGKRSALSLASEYELISKMIYESSVYEDRERAFDDALTEKACAVLAGNGINGGEIRVWGDRIKRVIGAARDKDGKVFTSDKFKRELQEAIGLRLGKYEYYKKEDTVLFKAVSVPKFAVSFARAGVEADLGEVSGDSGIFFQSNDAFFALLSDGMGSGREARDCSDFVTRYLSFILKSDANAITAISALNHILRNKSGEFTASLDLFRFDLINGDALFIKSGAAPSYIKRESSIFRIRSETCPIGLMKSVDAEKICVEVKTGDYIIMLSDGVSVSVHDSPWLLTFLGGTVPESAQTLAKSILTLAKEKSKSRDDMSVLVIKIEEANC